MTDLTEKRKAAMRDCAVRYERQFPMRLSDRIEGLLAQYPDVIAPNWLSWEGLRFTNADTSAKLRRWYAILTE